MTRQERRVMRAARVLTNYLVERKAQWVGEYGLRYLVQPYRVRPLINAIVKLDKIAALRRSTQRRGRK